MPFVKRQGSTSWMLALAALLLPAAAQAAEAGAEASRSITDSGSLYNALWSVGIFLVLVAILGKLAWNPVLRVLQQRERLVTDTLARADAQQRESQELLAQYQRQLQTAGEEISRRSRQAESQAEQARQEILAAARQQAEEFAHRATAEIDVARKAALDDLCSFGADLATAAAKAILQRELTAEDHRRLVAQAIEQIRQQADKVGSPG